MEKHNSIVQAEAAAACVGVILLALVIVTIVVLVVIIRMRHKMKEKSEFSIHISRNFNSSLREKETPVSDFDRNSFDGLESKIRMPTPDSPFREHTSSFIAKKVTPSSFTNPRASAAEPGDGSSSSETSLPSMETKEEPSAESSSKKDLLNEYETTKGDTQILSVETEPSKPLVAAPRPLSQSATPRRPPPQLPIIKPKPYTGPSSTAASKPLVPDKPAVSAKPPKIKQPVLPPINKPVTGDQDVNRVGEEVRVVPDVKPKPKVVPRKI